MQPISHLTKLLSFCAAAFLLLAAPHGSALAANGLKASLVAGSASDAELIGVNVARATPYWAANLGGAWHAELHWEGSLHHLKGDAPGGSNTFIIGLTPMLEFSKAGGSSYLEIGVGANYFEDKEIYPAKVMGTHFQFGDVIGAGFRFGRHQQFEVGYRFVHYSNAGISTQNPGLDLHLIRIKGVF